MKGSKGSEGGQRGAKGAKVSVRGVHVGEMQVQGGVSVRGV